MNLLFMLGELSFLIIIENFGSRVLSPSELMEDVTRSTRDLGKVSSIIELVFT